MKRQITKNVIEASFVRLLDERPFDKITVRDIVEDCGLTRNTFYYHYENIFDIAEEIIDRLIGEAVDEVDGGARWEDVFLGLVDFALENRRLTKHLFQSTRGEELARYFGKAGEVVLDHYVTRCCVGEPVQDGDRALIRRLGLYALSGVLHEWMATGMRGQLEAEVRRAGVLFEGTVEQAVAHSRKTRK